MILRGNLTKFQEWEVMPDLFFYREVKAQALENEDESEEEGDGEDEEREGNYVKVSDGEGDNDDDEDDDWRDEEGGSGEEDVSGGDFNEQ